MGQRLKLRRATKHTLPQRDLPRSLDPSDLPYKPVMDPATTPHPQPQPPRCPSLGKFACSGGGNPSAIKSVVETYGGSMSHDVAPLNKGLFG